MNFARFFMRWKGGLQEKISSSRSFSSIAADSNPSPKHFGKKSDAFTRVHEMPVPFPPTQTPPAAAAPPPTATTLKRTLNFIGNVLFFGGIGVGSVVGYYTYFYDQTQIRDRIEERRRLGGLLNSTWCGMMEYYLEKRTYFEGEIKSFAVPRQDRLLPDLNHPGVKTLVLDLDEVLVYSEWTRLSGWKVFELVVYSDQPSSYVDPIMDRLDHSGETRARFVETGARHFPGAYDFCQARCMGICYWTYCHFCSSSRRIILLMSEASSKLMKAKTFPRPSENA